MKIRNLIFKIKLILKNGNKFKKLNNNNKKKKEEEEEQQQQHFSLRLKWPFTCIINAPSKAGKTYLINFILTNYKQTTTNGKLIDFILICYRNFQTIYEKWGTLAITVIYQKGLPAIFEEFLLPLFLPGRNNFLILDDVDIQDKDRSNLLAQLFTVCLLQF